MSKHWPVLVVIFLSTPVLWGQAKSEGFIIDPAKPYVFIEFDHIGNRQPLSTDESRTGLWLRIVNNCRIPIKIFAFDPGTGDPGLGVQYEVVGVKPSFGNIAGGVLHDNVPKNVPHQVILYPKESTTHIISPGGNLLFSVPANHVQPEWYLQFEFWFALPKPAALGQPITLVQFHYGDIPIKFREMDQP